MGGKKKELTFVKHHLPADTAGTLFLFTLQSLLAFPVFPSVNSRARKLRFRFRICQLLAM